MSRIAEAVAVTAATAAVLAGSAGMATADATAEGAAIGSPGVLSGHVLQVPIHVPINVCGNTVNVIGLLNPAFGNTCINSGGDYDKRDHHKGDYRDEHGALSTTRLTCEQPPRCRGQQIMPSSEPAAGHTP